MLLFPWDCKTDGEGGDSEGRVFWFIFPAGSDMERKTKGREREALLLEEKKVKLEMCDKTFSPGH